MAPENICLKTRAATFRHRPFPAARDLNITEVDGKCRFVVDSSSSKSYSYYKAENNNSPVNPGTVPN